MENNLFFAFTHVLRLASETLYTLTFDDMFTVFLKYAGYIGWGFLGLVVLVVLMTMFKKED